MEKKAERSAYVVHLGGDASPEESRASGIRFDGPLDMLLHLIAKHELDVADIIVSDITGEYLSMVEQADTYDPEAAGEFLAMAATLVYLKSRRLLPAPPEEADGTGEAAEDPEQQLIRQLREYKAMKEAAALLEERLALADRRMARLPEDVPLPPAQYEPEGLTVEALRSAFLSLIAEKLRTAPLHELHDVRPDRFTVSDCRARLRSLLKGRRSPLSFRDVFGPDSTKGEMIVTFMAMLDMLSHGELTLRQEEPFGEIFISPLNLLKNDGTQYRETDAND